MGNWLDEFPQLTGTADTESTFVYLNSGTHGLCPQSVLIALDQLRKNYESNPSFGLMNVWGELWKQQGHLARALDAHPKDLFFRTNVTHALNDILQTLELPEGAEIVATSHDYGAITNICRMRAERSHLHFRILEMPSLQELKNFSCQRWVDYFLSGVTPKTRCVVLYHVYSAHGLVLPIEPIAEAMSRKNITVVVDGAHGPGSLPIKLNQLKHVKIYSGNLHKWWLAPKGTAFAWVHESVQSQMQPLQAGWPTYAEFLPFSDFAPGYRWTQRMSLLGCHDFSPFLVMGACADFWERHGLDDLRGLQQRRLQQISDQFKNSPALFSEIQLHSDCSIGPMRAWILPERFRKIEIGWLLRDILARTQVQVAFTHIEDQNLLRLAPHFYNSESLVASALGKLETYFRENINGNS
jgi:isopenicillin-N epimerase